MPHDEPHVQHRVSPRCVPTGVGQHTGPGIPDGLHGDGIPPSTKAAEITPVVHQGIQGTIRGPPEVAQRWVGADTPTQRSGIT